MHAHAGWTFRPFVRGAVHVPAWVTDDPYMAATVLGTAMWAVIPVGAFVVAGSSAWAILRRTPQAARKDAWCTGRMLDDTDCTIDEPGL